MQSIGWKPVKDNRYLPPTIGLAEETSWKKVKGKPVWVGEKNLYEIKLFFSRNRETL